MAIRTITWTVQEDGMGLSPAGCRDGGVQGDHNKTRAEFILPSLLRSSYEFYIEYVDTFGGFDTTELLTVENGRVGVLLPLAWTQHGGEATLRLVAVKEGETGYTLEGKVRYHSRTGLIEKVKALIDGCIQAMLTRTEKAADRIEAAEAALTDGEARVQKAVEDAAAAKSAAETALENAAAASREAAGAITAVTSVSDSAKADVKETADQAKEKAESAAENAVQVVTDVANSVQGVYIGSGDMPEGYSVQIDPDGDVLEIDTELDEESGNPVTNAAIAKALAENRTAITCGSDEPSGGIDRDVYIQFIEE